MGKVLISSPCPPRPPARAAQPRRGRGGARPGAGGHGHLPQLAFPSLAGGGGAETCREHKNKQMGLWSFHDLLCRV